MKFKIGKSQIEGKGLIVKEPIREGELIGLAHIDDQPTDVVGKYHNHSEEPSAANVQMGNKRYLFALRELNPGDEITTDYRKQPELEQPKDFKKGGEYTPQKDGYRTYSPFKNLPYIDIESDTIDTDNIVYDLKLIGNNGITKIVAKNSGMHTIPGATVIREIPIKKRGGLVKMPKPSKKGLASKAYTKSLDGTNKLFTESYLFEKPKSRKRKVFDPNAKYFQEGGELPEDYQQFLNYSITAPENRQPGPGYFYGSPDEYDHYGMWETLGKPNSFEEALEMNPDWQQDEEGYYHGYSVNPYTGVFLKAGAPGLEEGDTKWMEIKDHYLSTRANESTPVYDTDLQRFRYIPSKEKGGFHDDLGKYRKVLKHIIYGAGVGLTKAEYGMPMGSGMSQNYMGRTKSFYQDGGENRALTPTGEEDLYSAGELEQVTVKDKMPDWARFQKEYQSIKPLESYIAEEKKKYLRRGNKALNKMAGVTETNFPKDVEERFRQEYNQKMNTYTTRKLGKKQGFNPRRRGEWVDELSQKEFEVVGQSKYGSKLSPDVWSRFLSGAQGAANTLLPGQPVNFNIPGYTKREMQDARENSLEAFELLAPADLPGIAIANKLTNANIENPNILSGETMANVSPLATAGLNPLLAVDMFGLTKLPKSIYTGTKALGKGAGAAGKKATQSANRYLSANVSDAPVRSGIGGMDMSRYEIKNPDYFTQLLNTYDSRKMSPKNRKFYEGLIASIKKQDGLVSERQYNELQRLKTGDFNFGKKAYQEGGEATAPTQQEAITSQDVPSMFLLTDVVTPQVETLVNEPVKEATAVIPTKKEVEKIAMPKIQQSGNVFAIQKKLVAAGYDIGKTGSKKDGVDGIMGNKTKMALDAFNAGIPPSKTKIPQGKTTTDKNKVVNTTLDAGYLPYLDKGEEICVKGKGCSYNASKKIKDLLGNITDASVWADDAWFNKSNIINKGGDLLYETTEKDFSKMGKVPKELYSKLQVGDYVQLDRINTKTSYEYEAKAKPGTKNEKVEHLGFVVGKDKDGTPLIWHASESGNAYIKRIDEDITLDDHDKSIFNYKVSSIVRDPKLKNADMRGLQNSPYYAAIDPKQKLLAKENSTATQKQAVNTINNSIKNLKNLGYSQEDANFIGQILVGGIMQNETKGGESLKRIPKEMAATVWKNVLGQENFEGDEASIGYYQMKPTLNFLNKDGTLNKQGQQLEKLGVDPKDISTFDIDAQTKAGTIILLNNYEELKKDKDFNVKTGLYKNKIPASYILAKSWQAGVDWQNREKYTKFLNNLDVDYSDNALKNAIGSISVTGSNKTVNNDYAKVKAAQSKIDAQKAEAQRKAYEAKAAAQRKQQSEYNKGKAQAKNPGYAESTAIRNLPKGPMSTYKKQIDDLVKNSKKPPPKKPAYTSSFGKLNEQIAKANPYSDLYKPRFQSGGYIEAELTPEEIEAYRAEGWIVEDL